MKLKKNEDQSVVTLPILRIGYKTPPFLLAEIAFIYYMATFGVTYIKDFGTLGTHGRGFNPDGTVSYGDNSFLILLYSLLTIIIVIAFIFVWRMNVRQNRDGQRALAQGKKLPTVKQDLMSLLDEHFDKTLLALPTLGIFLFIVLPIIFMICVAFTNYDSKHQAPAQLFTWVGLDIVNAFSVCVLTFCSCFIFNWIWMQNAKT